MIHKIKFPTLAIAALVGLAATFTVSSCSKDDNPKTTTPTKTLNKANIVDKLWQNQGGTRLYQFDSDGKVMGSAFFNWDWVNNSDTLMIKEGVTPYEVLIIEWNTDTEMSCRYTGQGDPSVLFKTTKW
jgi:hypothetical protein